MELLSVTDSAAIDQPRSCQPCMGLMGLMERAVKALVNMFWHCALFLIRC